MSFFMRHVKSQAIKVGTFVAVIAIDVLFSTRIERVSRNSKAC